MPRKPSKTFTDKELEVMKILWELGEATVRQIQEQLPGLPHYNNVLTIIRVLEKKGHILHREEGKSFVYRAKESRDKARKRILGHLIEQVFGGSATSLVLNLIETGDISKEELDIIRKRVKDAGKAKEKP